MLDLAIDSSCCHKRSIANVSSWFLDLFGRCFLPDLFFNYLSNNLQRARSSQNRTDVVQTLVQSDMPQNRNGKHKQVITTILKNLEALKVDSAIKVRLAELAESKEKVCSVLSRATRKAGGKVATSSDATFLYVWNVSK